MTRRADHKVADIFINRWSPRAMSGESVGHEELMSLFEAAHWAPSSYNNQPWRFIYARRDTQAWDALFSVMVAFNQSWAQHAAVLVVVVSHTIFDYNGKPSRSHSFDTGAAWQNLALQGSMNGLVVHAMEGFDYDRAKKDLNIPADYQVECMIAIGRPGKIELLPSDLQKKEVPSDRKKVEEIAFEGMFKP